MGQPPLRVSPVEGNGARTVVREKEGRRAKRTRLKPHDQMSFLDLPQEQQVKSQGLYL